jgi:hypothetical protein
VPDQPPIAVSDSPSQETAAYLAAVAPVFEMLVRVTSQLGTYLLLSAHEGPTARRLDHGLCDRAQEHLAELTDRLSGVRVPSAASRHRWAVGKAAAALQQALFSMEGSLTTPGRRDRLGVPPDSLKFLNSAHRLLQWAAKPSAGLATIDLEHACCSCARVGQDDVRLAR